MVTPQSAKAINDNSSAVGPLSVPPEAVGKSQTTLCVLVLSAIERTFSNSLAFALILAISFTDMKKEELADLIF